MREVYTQPNLNGYSVGGRIIKGDIAPHLDFGLDDKIEITVNRNAKFEVMVRMFDDRDVIYLADFARLTKYPNKLHSMAKERGWVAITSNNRVVGYRNPEILSNVIKENPKNQQGLNELIRKLLVEKGIFNVADLISAGFERDYITTSVSRLRKDGYVIESVRSVSGKNNTAVSQYKLMNH